MPKTLQLIRLKGQSIYEQLQIEEGLLRAGKGNYCIINSGVSDAIVMGNSADPKSVIDFAKIKKRPVPIIKRFSGGGTVYVDADTLFVSFIFDKEDVSVAPYPKPILDWTANLYQKALFLDHFALSENDYTLGKRKIGGNAQYIKKNRWLHHTTFLWDYRSENMDYLLMPPKVPLYREGRCHEDFVTTLNDYMEKEAFFHRITAHLEKTFFLTEICPPRNLACHPKTTTLFESAL